MNKKIILIIIIVAVGIGFFVYRGFIREEVLEFVYEKVIRGTVAQEVFETGTVKKIKEVNLSFRGFGRIEEIYVEVGQEVKVGQKLIRLETNHLDIQLAGAKASLGLVQAGLNRLLAGVSQEEIDLAQTAVANAEIALVHTTQSLVEKRDLSKTSIGNVEIVLSDAKRNLEDVRIKTDISRSQAYEDALSVLSTAYLKLYNTFNVVDRIQRAYFTRNNQEGIMVRRNEKRIENALDGIRVFRQLTKNSPQEEIDFALSKTRIALSATVDALGIIREICETSVYRYLVSQADKAALDIERRKINTSLVGIIDVQQAISLIKETNKIKITGAQAIIDSAKGRLQAVKDTNEISISGAQAKIDSVEGHLQVAKNTLAIKKAGARQVDIDIHNAQIRQAQAKINLLKEQLADTLLKSPVQGVVGQINQEVGEMVSIGIPIISVLLLDDFQVEANIFEEDIVKIEIGNPVEIILIAFPDEPLIGRVVLIDSMEKLIGGVVHYGITIDFEEEKQGIRQGMTADIIIKAEIRKDVLIISEDAIRRIDGNFVVQIYKDGLIQERIIEIGLRGEDDRVEIISGIEEGEKVIVE